jgi:hypothetical protein
MEKILLSSLVGVITYFVLSAGTQFSDSKIDALQLKGGEEENANLKKNCDIFPECFIVEDKDDESEKYAQQIFKVLIARDLCGTPAYNDLAQLYSRIFCFEIALGNNPNHPDHIEKEKVMQLLTLYSKLPYQYGVKTISVENNNVSIVKSPTFIKDFMLDIDINAKKAYDTLVVTPEIMNKHKLLMEKHQKNIQELYDNLNI